MYRKVSVTEDGVTLVNECYNNRFISSNIKIDQRVSNLTRRWKVKSAVGINVVIMNLIASVLKKSRLHYSRDKNCSTAKSRYNRKGISNYVIMKAIDTLEQLGYVNNYVATRQFNTEYKMSSWISASPKFLAEFCTDTELSAKADAAYIAEHLPIILRDEDKLPVDYRDEMNLRAIASVVHRLNAVNGTYRFIDPEGLEFENLYTRVFNNSSFEEGGRWYKAGILNMENKQSKNRLRILIDSEAVAEVDYSNLHLRIVAERKGCTNLLASDAYLMPLSVLQGTEINRSLIKYSVNLMLNCVSRRSACQAVQSHLNSAPKGTYCFSKGTDVVDAIYKAFPQFDDVFCQKISSGLLLQNTDSWLVHYVANVFSTMGYPLLPVHDSFICRKQDVELLIETMSCAYKQTLNTENKAAMKINYIENNALVIRDVSC